MPQDLLLEGYADVACVARCQLSNRLHGDAGSHRGEGVRLYDLEENPHCALDTQAIRPDRDVAAVRHPEDHIRIAIAFQGGMIVCPEQDDVLKKWRRHA